MRAFIGRRTLKYIGLPAIVSAGLVWKGRDHLYKSARSWPTNDVLLNVQVIHRHGDRLPITFLRNNNEKVKQNTADTDVANIIQSTITEGAYARLKGLVRVPKLNGKTVKIVAYVEKKERWKVKLLHPQHMWRRNSRKKYLGVREENLDPILDWELISSEKQTSIGERVKTRKGQYGIVNTTDTDASFQWKQVSAKLNGTYMVYKKDNYDIESTYLVSSKDNDPQTQCMITLGTWLRERYVQQLAFLPPTYQNMTNPHISIPPRKSKPKQEAPSVYYISTNSQRCIHSADALLQGLYPLQNRSEDSSIPIHCDVANTWLYPNPCIKQKLCTFYDIGIDRLEYVSSRMCKLHCLDRVSMRLSVGSLLNKLYQNMKHLETKFVVYSARDGTLQRLLVALANGNDFTFPWPSYSASLIFEVWEKNIIEEGDKDSFVMTIKDWMNGVDRSRAKYVRILYEGHVLHLNGDEFTPIDGFQQMWKDLMVNEDTYWDRECVC
eukprot:127974_1